MKLTKVIFIRHGEADGNIDRVFHGHYNSDLTENGVRQIKLTAERLRDTNIDAIYSSDLKRTYKTAEAIAQGRNMEIITDERLREINGGQWEDVPWDELPNKFPESYGFWLNNPLHVQMPDGESMIEFQNRIYDAVQEKINKHIGKVLCIVTHGTALRVLLCKYHNKSLSDLAEIAWNDNASITVVEYDDKLSPKIVVAGDNGHLGDYSTLAKQSWWRKTDKKGDN
ncbi:MAG: histidine phosphatase family protein [Clostridiaceae bacterium]|nr:histidine phosphatase family protein [Clostridiaceae bacterium]